MNNARWNIASLDKLRGRLTKKNISSLLILSVLTIALLPASTAAFASSNERESDTSATDNTLMSIHMLDKTHGWALTQNLVLKTADGGLHWQNVLPANAFGTATVWDVHGDFLNDQDAWIVAAVGTVDTVMILHTTNSGKSWQHSTIHTPATSPDVKFLNASDGWIQSYQVAPTTVESLFHTTDSGQHWNQVASPNPPNLKHIVFFSDGQNGWEAGSGTGPQPPLKVTHDGGQTWQSQSLPALPGANKSAMLRTNPPVFFGNNGLLPVQDKIASQPGSQSSSIGLNLYVTLNGGQTWTPTRFLTIQGLSDSPIVDAVDIQHVWAAIGTDLYATSNGGQSWTKLPSAPQSITELNFVDANTGWAITPTNLLHTTNGGHTWQPIN